MPYADPEKQKEYFRRYDANRQGTADRKRQNREKSARWKAKQDQDALRAKWREEKKAAYPAEREKRLAREKSRRERLGETLRARKRELRRKKIDQYRAMDLRTYRKHRAAKLARRRRYYAANKPAILSKGKAYRVAHHAEVIARVTLRAMRKKSLTRGDPKAIKALYVYIYTAPDIVCHWCGRPVPAGRRHVDHYNPLALGGFHEVSNLVPACAGCNMAKSDTPPDEFRRAIAATPEAYHHLLSPP